MIEDRASCTEKHSEARVTKRYPIGARAFSNRGGLIIMEVPRIVLLQAGRAEDSSEAII